MTLIISKQGQISSLTGIRFFAAAYVFIFHYGASAISNTGVPRPLAIFLHNGYVGVSMFFILSGFILSHAHKNRPVKYADSAMFFKSRFARIYPVYLFALLITLPLDWKTLGPVQVISVLTLTQSWTWSLSSLGSSWIMQAWTLSIELAFYISFPLLFRLANKCHAGILGALAFADVLFMVYAGVANLHPGFSLFDFKADPIWLAYVPLPILRGTEFFYGIIIYAILQRLVVQKIYVNGNVVAIILTISMLCLLAVSANSHVVSLASAVFGVLIAALYVSNSIIKTFLGQRIFYVLGASSYALYITQYPFHEYCLKYLQNFHGKLLAFPICICLSILVWYLLEEPAKRMIMSANRPIRATPKPAYPQVIDADP